MENTDVITTCPKCNSSNIEKSEAFADIHANAIYRIVTCNNCSHETKEIL